MPRPPIPSRVKTISEFDEITQLSFVAADQGRRHQVRKVSSEQFFVAVAHARRPVYYPNALGLPGLEFVWRTDTHYQKADGRMNSIELI